MQKKTVTRSHISQALKEKFFLSRKESLDVLELVLEEISDSLKQGKEVKIPLFGVFFTRFKKERLGRNPKTLESANIPARHVVSFRVSRLMKARVDATLKKKSSR